MAIGAAVATTAVAISVPSVAGITNPCGRTKVTPAWKHVVVVVMENKEYSAIIGKSTAPYINSLAKQCGLVTNGFAITHPSLPNYLAMTGGSTFGVKNNDNPPANKVNAPSIFGQTSSRSLMQGMKTNCQATDVDNYEAHHNPEVYFTPMAAACKSNNVPLGATPNLSAAYTILIPDNCQNMHDRCTDASAVASGDTYLSTLIPRLIASPEYQAGNTAIFLTWDEGAHKLANKVATVVISPSTQAGSTSKVKTDHYGLLRTQENMLGIPCLANACSATVLTGLGL